MGVVVVGGAKAGGATSAPSARPPAGVSRLFAQAGVSDDGADSPTAASAAAAAAAAGGTASSAEAGGDGGGGGGGFVMPLAAMRRASHASEVQSVGAATAAVAAVAAAGGAASGKRLSDGRVSPRGQQSDAGGGEATSGGGGGGSGAAAAATPSLASSSPAAVAAKLVGKAASARDVRSSRASPPPSGTGTTPRAGALGEATNEVGGGGAKSAGDGGAANGGGGGHSKPTRPAGAVPARSAMSGARAAEARQRVRAENAAGAEAMSLMLPFFAAFATPSAPVNTVFAPYSAGVGGGGGGGTLWDAAALRTAETVVMERTRAAEGAVGVAAEGDGGAVAAAAGGGGGAPVITRAVVDVRDPDRDAMVMALEQLRADRARLHREVATAVAARADFNSRVRACVRWDGGVWCLECVCSPRPRMLPARRSRMRGGLCSVQVAAARAQLSESALRLETEAAEMFRRHAASFREHERAAAAAAAGSGGGGGGVATEDYIALLWQELRARDVAIEEAHSNAQAARLRVMAARARMAGEARAGGAAADQQQQQQGRAFVKVR